MGLLDATLYVASVPQIDLARLADEGIRLILVDRDNTLVPRNTRVAPAEVLAWIAQAREMGFAVRMVSNNIHTNQVAASAKELGCGFVDHAMKPAPFAIQRAMRMEGATKETTVLIGDQLLTDVLGGNLAGIKTILVRPQSKRDMFYTYLFRVVERALLANKHFEGEDA